MRVVYCMLCGVVKHSVISKRVSSSQNREYRFFSVVQLTAFIVRFPCRLKYFVLGDGRIRIETG